MDATWVDEANRVILYLLYDGRTHDDILAEHPDFTREDIARACGEGLAALESGPRLETREERIARLRHTHPRAYAPWTREEDARLLEGFRDGTSLAALARDAGRQPNAVRARLEKLLGPDWRDQRPAPPPR